MTTRKLIAALILTVFPMAASASEPEREENCLLGQETAALFYTMLQTDPDQAERVLRRVDTRIAKHAHYWAKSYLDKNQDLHTLVTDYLTLCLRTGPARMPLPPIEKLK
ncbi:MAG: hypothetical protein QNJ05_10695 [Woeseiaceae bacterium]|nr:hypothetical protein [Woeseiaceae bacterium]